MDKVSSSLIGLNTESSSPNTKPASRTAVHLSRLRRHFRILLCCILNRSQTLALRTCPYAPVFSSSHSRTACTRLRQAHSLSCTLFSAYQGQLIQWHVRCEPDPTRHRFTNLFIFYHGIHPETVNRPHLN